MHDRASRQNQLLFGTLAVSVALLLGVVPYQMERPGRSHLGPHSDEPWTAAKVAMAQGDVVQACSLLLLADAAGHDAASAAADVVLEALTDAEEETCRSAAQDMLRR